MRSIQDDLYERSKFRLAVKQLIEAEIARRQKDFIATEGEDSFSLAAIRAAVLLEVTQC